MCRKYYLSVSSAILASYAVNITQEYTYIKWPLAAAGNDDPLVYIVGWLETIVRMYGRMCTLMWLAKRLSAVWFVSLRVQCAI